jgi:glyceraldehyde-3-phosphate dehydrogenase (NAD(P))
MTKKIVHVVGTGTIGEPLIGLLSDYKSDLGIDEITFHKRTPLKSEHAKVLRLLKRGARLVTDQEAFEGFKDIGLSPAFSTVEAIDRACVVIDCTPKGVGHKNKVNYYHNYDHNTLGFIAQGSETGFGKPYARGINDEALIHGEDRFLQVVSCNTHNLSSLVKTIGIHNGDPDNLLDGRFVMIRRANDLSQANDFIPAPEVGHHSSDRYGTHHAKDAANLFKTLGYDLNIFSSAMKLNTQYMHIVHFNLKMKEPLTMTEVMEIFENNPLVAITEKKLSSQVFSFGRDHGHYGRILNQMVISIPSLQLIDGGKELVGFCFTPQDGNSLLSSISAATWFMYLNSYEQKIQSLSDWFFDEV